MMQRKTKKQILEEACYRPKRGRPPISDENSTLIGVRLPESVAKKIPEPKGARCRDVILAHREELARNARKPPLNRSGYADVQTIVKR